MTELPQQDAEVWRAVRALPRRQVQVIALRYLADAPVAKIAQTLGWPRGRSRRSSTPVFDRPPDEATLAHELSHIRSTSCFLGRAPVLGYT